jgi:glyoxylase-like metal-dependent hydrolase (beta-lactamase superfamily II)
MLVHHLNCGTMRPFGGRLINSAGSAFGASRMVCHCLLIETEQGLVLVDSGLGAEDVTRGVEVLGRFWTRLTRPVLSTEETAAAQVIRLGYRPEDVRHIVLTHLDRDHAGGIPDFPKAKVHVPDTEYRAAISPRSSRYLPHQWAHGPDWVLHRADDGEHWCGFDAVRELPGLPPEILLVSLPGHTRGHSGVAVRTDDRWLLHAGDAYMFHGEMHAEKPWCSPGLRVFQNIVQVEGAARKRTRDRLRERLLAHPEVEVFSAHDPLELDRYVAV